MNEKREIEICLKETLNFLREKFLAEVKKLIPNFSKEGKRWITNLLGKITQIGKTLFNGKKESKGSQTDKNGTSKMNKFWEEKN